MRSLVTGCAGFVGSHLSERLIDLGYEVVGIDNLNDNYSVQIKKKNLEKLLDNTRFEFFEGDLLSLNLEEILKEVDFIFHQAAQAGVRSSWGKYFKSYTDNNILATQMLLESVKNKKLKKFVYASSSSVYGDCNLPMKEDIRPIPISPYGVSKLAAENLCQLYNENYNVPTISLRYFTVYGPRQRPDMAFHKFIKAIFQGEKIIVYGSGKQTRDFSYIDDVVNANILAMNFSGNGEIFNIGGGTRIKLEDVITLIGQLMGKKPNIEFVSQQKGDVKDTQSDVTKSSCLLSYSPKIIIEKGLPKEIEWIESLLKETPHLLRDK